MDYWSFLIAANENWDYRVVLCPDFIEQAGRRSILRNCFDPSTALAEGTGSRDFVDDKAGTVSLYFRACRIKDGDRDAYDDSGRPLVMISGIAVRSRSLQERSHLAAAKCALEHAQPEISNIFARVRAAQTPPQLVLSHIRSCSELGTYRENRKPPVLIEKEAGMNEEPSGQLRRTVLERYLPVAALALAFAAIVGAGAMYFGAHARSIELSDLTESVNKVEAQVMLERAVVAMDADEKAALEEFSNEENGFRDRGLYVFCPSPGDGIDPKILNLAWEGKFRDVANIRPQDGPKVYYVTKVHGRTCGVAYRKIGATQVR
jgi:hypothetical protein